MSTLNHYLQEWEDAFNKIENQYIQACAAQDTVLAANQELQNQLQALQKKLAESENQKEQLSVDLGEYKRLYENNYRVCKNQGTEIEQLKKDLALAKATNSALSAKLQAVQEVLAGETQSLAMVRQQVGKLEEEKAALIPQEAQDIALSLLGYLQRLQEASEYRTDAKGVKPQWHILVNRDGIHTLFYSYDPQEVTHALRHLRKFAGKMTHMKQEEKRVRKEILFHVSTALGYCNLFTYLSLPNHKDSSFMEQLCDLSVPTWKIKASADELDTLSWLEKHLPPNSQLPNSDCCFTREGVSPQNGSF